MTNRKSAMKTTNLATSTTNELLDGYQRLRKALGKPPWTTATTRWNEPEPRPLTKKQLLSFGLSAKEAGFGNLFVDSRMREKAIERFGFAIPTDEALQAIASHGPVVEIGAGLGYWAYLMKEHFNATVRCYDKAPVTSGRNTYSFKDSAPYVEVLSGSHEVLADHPNDTLLLIWPYMDSFADDCLQAYQGNTVAYVGEGNGGCTADGVFHARLAFDWHVVQTVRIPQWWGLNDDLQICQRGPSPDLVVPEKCDCCDWRLAPACLKCWRAGHTKSQKVEE